MINIIIGNTKNPFFSVIIFLIKLNQLFFLKSQNMNFGALEKYLMISQVKKQRKYYVY